MLSPCIDDHIVLNNIAKHSQFEVFRMCNQNNKQYYHLNHLGPPSLWIANISLFV